MTQIRPSWSRQKTPSSQWWTGAEAGTKRKSASSQPPCSSTKSG